MIDKSLYGTAVWARGCVLQTGLEVCFRGLCGLGVFTVHRWVLEYTEVAQHFH